MILYVLSVESDSWNHRPPQVSVLPQRLPPPSLFAFIRQLCHIAALHASELRLQLLLHYVCVWISPNVDSQQPTHQHPNH